MSRSVRPPIHKIAFANLEILWTLGLDPLGAMKRCWACGMGNIRPTRAHVVAHSHGGSDDPENFFLLCGHCHEAQPDGATRETQIDWLLFAESTATWSGRLADRFLSELREWSNVRGYGVAFDAWIRGTSFERKALIFRRGYAKAAGSENARGNLFSIITREIKEAADAFALAGEEGAP